MLELGAWINKSSLERHLGSEAHHTQAFRQNERQQQQIAAQERLRNIYSMNDAIPNPEFEGPSITDARAGLFDTVQPPDNNFDMDLFPHPLIPTYIEPIIHDPAVERERLRRQIEQMLLEAEHRDEFGADDSDDDITVTNIAEEFRALGTLNYFI